MSNNPGSDYLDDHYEMIFGTDLLTRDLEGINDQSRYDKKLHRFYMGRM